MLASLPIQKIVKKTLGHNKPKANGIGLAKDKGTIA